MNATIEFSTPLRPRRLRALTAIVTAAATLALAGIGVEPSAADPPQSISVEGEAATQTNIPIATSPQASGGRYLRLNTSQAPPAQGWFATYTVNVPKAGVYRLDAVISSPAGPDRYTTGGSYFNLSVNGATPQQVAKSEPYWSEAPSAWGELFLIRLGDIELNEGANTLKFTVNERRLLPAPGIFSFSLDQFSLTPTPIALESVHLGNPAVNLGTYRPGESPTLTFRLNGRTPAAQVVRYTITDYFSAEVASGTRTIPAGAASTSVAVPTLPPGNYTVEATLDSAPDAPRTGYFAKLPAQVPVSGPANRFAVMTAAPELVPSSRLDALADGLKQMGIGYVRDEVFWPTIEPARGQHDSSAFSNIAREFHQRGIKTLEVWGSNPGAQAPDWARSVTSGALPADLRDGYTFARRLAQVTDGVGRDALELWNEPEQTDFCCSTGDRMGAYVKAAALGIHSVAERPLVALPGIFTEGAYQDLMLDNKVGGYADIWSFHSYPLVVPVPGGLTPFAPQSDIQVALQRAEAPHTKVWTTEAGIFTPSTPGPDMSHDQQVDQARYLVQSAVQDFAAGSDKRFWFTGSPCCAGPLTFGLVSRDFQPWPAYSAHAAMASILGEANFAHRVQGLPANVSAYRFKNGGQAITVVWADSPTTVNVPTPGTTASVYNIMGRLQSSGSVNGQAVQVTASLDPIYLVTNGGAGLSARPTANDDLPTVGQLAPAKRIVLSQEFGNCNTAPEKSVDDPPPYGYRLEQSTSMTVDVYNFDDTTRQVQVTANPPAGWSASATGSTTVTVPPMGRVGVPFTLTASGQVERGRDYRLVFQATTGGQSVPRSASLIQRRGGVCT